MKLTRLALWDFAPYEQLEYAADAGLTLVTGDNGAGKSTLVEAVAWCLYGLTIRGGSRTRCQVTATFDTKHGEVVVGRNRSQKGMELSLSVGGITRSCSTVTDTQLRIEDLFGTWERFVSTRVFAKEFLARFGAATDKDRKALLEEVLGLGQFDAAGEVAREKCREQNAETAQHEAKAGALVESVTHAKQQVADLSAAAIRGLDAVDVEMLLCQEKLHEREEKHRKLLPLVHTAALRFDERKVVRLDIRKRLEYSQIPALDKTKQRIAEVRSLTKCPTCAREMDDAHRAEMLRQLAADQAQLQHDLAELEQALVNEDSEVAGAQEEHMALSLRQQALEREMFALRQESAKLAGERQAAAIHEGEMAKARARYAQVYQRWQEHDADARVSRGKAAVLQAAAEVFGLRGARVMMLARALDRLEAETNAVLDRLGLGLRIVLASSSPLKSGKSVDTIGITVQGAGAGEYKSCSSGERARIDVALLLGLAAMGGDDGLLVFDEVFDSLDQEGVERVAAYLDQLGRSRQVMVITHHQDLRAHFPQARVLCAHRGASGATLDES